MEQLLNWFEPASNGGVLPPTLDWASGRIADAFDLSSPLRALQLAVAPGNASSTSEALDTKLSDWLRLRMRQHTLYFCLCGAAAVVWLVACCVLCSVTVTKERRRQRRLRKGDSGDDAVDAGWSLPKFAEVKELQRYSLFASFVRKRCSRLNRRKLPPPPPPPPAAADAPDGAASWAWAYQPGRVHEASVKAVRPGDLAVRCLTFASLLAVVVCGALLLVSMWKSAAFASVTSASSDGGDSGNSGGIRAMAASTLGHVDCFLNRSLAESNATVIAIFQSTQPQVQRLFRSFGQSLLASLKDDYKITPLFLEVTDLLVRLNETLLAMENVSASRAATILPLRDFTRDIDRSRSVLQQKSSSLCRRKPHAACHSVADGLRSLEVGINATRLDTDISVTIKTLKEEFNLNIDDVMQQVTAAQASLDNSLNAIGPAVDSLMDSLVGEVSRQFAVAGSIVADAKSRYEAAADDPQLWAAVGGANAGVVALLVVAGLVLAGACIGGCCLLATLLRHLRISRRLDRGGAGGQDTNNNSRHLQQQQLPEQLAMAYGAMEKPKKPAALNQKQAKLVEKEANSFVFCCAIHCSLLLLLLAAVAVLPLLLSFAAFYASAELHVDACRYVATDAGLQQWDQLLDEFLQKNVWPKVEAALQSQEALPIAAPEFPKQLLHAARSECKDANRTLFQIFRLQNSLNCTEILLANSTQKQFEFGAKLIRDKINETDVNAMLPAELQLLKPVLPRVASLLDKQDYSDSIDELKNPLLLLQSDKRKLLLQEAGSVAEAGLNDNDAVIMRDRLQELQETLSSYGDIFGSLQQLRVNFLLMQSRRNIGQRVARLLTALEGLEEVVADKEKMLQQVNQRYYSTLRQHVPNFARFLDPLAVRIFSSVGYCDDIARAFHVVADSFCGRAIHSIAAAALLLCVTVMAFGAFFTFCWLLLLRIRRHQLAAVEFERQRAVMPVAKSVTNCISVC